MEEIMLSCQTSQRHLGMFWKPVSLFLNPFPLPSLINSLATVCVCGGGGWGVGGAPGHQGTRVPGYSHIRIVLTSACS